MEADVKIPARGIVLFVHGSGSSRHSKRNRFIARTLNEAGLATLLFDLLTREEEAMDLRTAHFRFDIGLLAERLGSATDWVLQEPAARDLRIGYFGSSTGAAAALVTAAARPHAVGAVVSRGGRPDLAGGAPVNVLPAIQQVPEVCLIYCATANSVEVILAETEQGGGFSAWSMDFLRRGLRRKQISWNGKRCCAASGTSSEARYPPWE